MPRLESYASRQASIGTGPPRRGRLAAVVLRTGTQHTPGRPGGGRVPAHAGRPAHWRAGRPDPQRPLALGRREQLRRGEGEPLSASRSPDPDGRSPRHRRRDVVEPAPPRDPQCVPDGGVRPNPRPHAGREVGGDGHETGRVRRDGRHPIGDGPHRQLGLPGGNPDDPPRDVPAGPRGRPGADDGGRRRRGPGQSLGHQPARPARSPRRADGCPCGSCSTSAGGTPRTRPPPFNPTRRLGFARASSAW